MFLESLLDPLAHLRRQQQNGTRPPALRQRPHAAEQLTEERHLPREPATAWAAEQVKSQRQALRPGRPAIERVRDERCRTIAR